MARNIVKNANWLPTIAEYVEDQLCKCDQNAIVDKEKIRNEAFLDWLRLTEPKLVDLLVAVNNEIELLR